MATEGQHQAQLKVEARVNQAEGSLKKLQAEFTKLTSKVDKQAKAQKRASKNLDTFQNRMDRMSTSVSKLTTGFGVAGLAGALGVAAMGVDRMFESTLKFDNVMRNLPFSIDAAKKASLGMTDAFTLAQNAVMAHRFGVAKTSQEYAKIVKIATKLALSTGKDVTQSVQDLTLALSRQSPKILDNLGIMLKLGEANKRYAASLGKSVEEMTEAERAQAFLTEGLKAGEEAAKRVTIETDNAAAAWARMKVRMIDVGHWIASDFVEDLGTVTLEFERWSNWLKVLSDQDDIFTLIREFQTAGFGGPRVARGAPDPRQERAGPTTAERIAAAKAEAQAAVLRAKQEKQLLEIRLKARQQKGRRGRGGAGIGRPGEDPLEKVLDDLAADVAARREAEESLQSLYDDVEERENARAERAQVRQDRTDEHFAKSLAKQQALQEKHLQFTMRITDRVAASFGAAAFSAIDSTETFGRAIAIEAGLAARSAARVLWVDSLKWTARGVAASIALSPRAPLFFAAAGKAAAGAAALGALGMGLGAATGTGLFAPGARLGGTTGGGGTLGTPSRGFGEPFTPQSEQLPSSATMRNTRSAAPGGDGDMITVNVQALEPTEEVGVRVAHSIRKAKRNGLNAELA